MGRLTDGCVRRLQSIETSAFAILSSRKNASVDFTFQRKCYALEVIEVGSVNMDRLPLDNRSELRPSPDGLQNYAV